MKKQPNENPKSAQRPQDIINLQNNKPRLVHGLSPLSHFETLNQRMPNLNSQNLLASQMNASPNLSHTIREDLGSFYGKNMDLTKLNILHPSMQNINGNNGLSSLLGHQANDPSRQINGSVNSYGQEEALLKSQKFSIQNGSSNFNFLNPPNMGNSHYLNPSHSFANPAAHLKPNDLANLSMNQLSTLSNANESKNFFFGNTNTSQYNQSQLQGGLQGLFPTRLNNLNNHRQTKNYDLSISQDIHSMANDAKLSMKSFGAVSHSENLVDLQKLFRNEQNGNIYESLKQLIRQAATEIEAEKNGKTFDLQNFNLMQNSIKRQTPSFDKTLEVKPNRITPEFVSQSNEQSTPVLDKQAIKLKIDFEPLGNRVSPSEYPQIKQEVMKAIQKIGEKYSNVLNLELQIKDMVIPRKYTDQVEADLKNLVPVKSKITFQPNRSEFGNVSTSNLFKGDTSRLENLTNALGTQKLNPTTFPEVENSLVPMTTIAEKVTGKDKDESLNILKNELFNVLENSFDDKITEEKKLMIRTQIIESTFLILKNLNCSSEKEYYKENFFNFFNLQLNIDPVKINSFSLKMKIRIACLLFCKYVNRTKILSFFEDFYEFVDIIDLDSAMASLNNNEQEADKLVSYEKDLWDLFYFRNFNEMGGDNTPQNMFSKKGVFLLRKLLILFIMLMDLCKSFLNLKTGEDLFKSNISEEVHKANHQKVKNVLQNNNYYNNKILKYSIDTSLYHLSLEALMMHVDVCFFQNYLLLTHVYLTKKFSKKLVNIRLKDKVYSFKFTLKEQEQIFCSKSKRRDELIKFSYKFIRKQIFKNFKKNLFDRRSDLSSNEDAKNEFYKEVLNGNKEAIDYFNSVDVSKKHLKKFQKCQKIVDMIHTYKDEKYIEEQIETNIFKKAETIFRDDLTFEIFLKCLFCGQHKHSVILQDIINSHNIFDLFFQI